MLKMAVFSGTVQKQGNQECLGFFEMACAGICHSEERCGCMSGAAVASVRFQTAVNIASSRALWLVPWSHSQRRLVPLYKACVLNEPQGALRTAAGFASCDSHMHDTDRYLPACTLQSTPIIIIRSASQALRSASGGRSSRRWFDCVH